jgi:nucleotide-binding universal stress UspA family protein
VSITLIAFDGSPSARAAVERAAVLLPGSDALVATVAHGLMEFSDAASAGRLALPDDVIRTAVARLRESTLEEAQEVADEGGRLAGQAGLQVRAQALGTDGPTWTALADAARDAGAGLIACGTHGHGRVARAILGSVSTALARNAELPVLIVPDRAPDPDGPLLIAYDGSDAAGHAIETCGRLLTGREAIVVHVWRSRIRHTLAGKLFERAPMRDVRDTITELDGMFGEWAQETAQRGADLARSHGLEARAHPVEAFGPPAHAILEAAAAEHASVVVAGRSGGSVVEALLHASERPMLIA